MYWCKLDRRELCTGRHGTKSGRQFEALFTRVVDYER